DPDAHYRLAIDLLRAGRLQPAHSHLTVAIAFRRDFAEAQLLRARTGLMLKRYTDAFADANSYLDRHPDDPAARLIRAQACRLSKRYGPAVADFSALIEKFPSHFQLAQLYELRSTCYDGLDKSELAKADRAKALELKSGDPTVLNNQAW